MNITCPICKQVFFTYQKNRKTCSKQCTAIFQQHRETHPCVECGKLITDRASRFKRAQRVFCNRVCAHKWEAYGKVLIPQLRNKDWCLDQYKTKSLRKIANVLNCGETTVYKYFKLHGIVLDKKQWLRAERSKWWKGGITQLQRAIRTCYQYKCWRKAVIAQSNNKCKICGSTNQLEVDHIKKFKFILLDNNIRTLNEARQCGELWKVTNGRVLCRECNKVDCNLNHIKSSRSLE